MAYPELQYHYPVVIVGAGPCGLTLANLLGIEGIKTLLLEQNATTVREPRAVSIDDEALRTMQAIEIVDEVMANVMPDYGSHYFTAQGKRFAKVEPATREHGYPRRSAFRQPQLESTLREGLKRFEHVDTAFEHKLKSFIQENESVSLSIQNPSETDIRLSCNFLVACDGGQSSIRHRLGIQMEGASYRQRWLIIDTVGSRNRFRHTKVYCNPARPGINLPGPGGTRRFEFMLHAHESDQQAYDAEFIRTLLHSHEEAQAEIVRKQVYTFHARVASRWREKRVFLAGDAAHLTPPFAGQGMNSGLRDAHNLSWKLAAVEKDMLPASVLHSYEAERKPHAHALIDMAVTMGRIMMPTSPLRAWLVQRGLQALKVCPPAQSYVSQMKFKPRPRFYSGMICMPRNRLESSVVGFLFPQPRLELPSGHITKLDGLLNRQFSLLIIAEHLRQELPAPQSIKIRLNLSRLWVTPAHMIPVERTDVQCVRDIENALKWYFNHCPDHVLLLRPDYYVAALIPLRELQSGSGMGTYIDEIISNAGESDLRKHLHR